MTRDKMAKFEDRRRVPGTNLTGDPGVIIAAMFIDGMIRNASADPAFFKTPMITVQISTLSLIAAMHCDQTA